MIKYVFTEIKKRRNTRERKKEKEEKRMRKNDDEKVFHVISMAYTHKHKNYFYEQQAKSLFSRENLKFCLIFHTPDPHLKSLFESRLETFACDKRSLPE